MQPMRSLHPDHLYTFSKVLETRSFSLAARLLGMTQPAVSQHVKELERRLQVRLIERVGRTLRPTAAGDALLPHAQRIELALADAEAQVRGLSNQTGGRVRIGAGATVCIHLLPPLLKKLRRFNPLLEIVVSTGNTPDMVRRVEDNVLDAALVTLPVASRSLEAVPVMADEFVAIAPRDEPAGRTGISATALGSMPLVLYERGANTRSLLDAWFRQAGTVPRPIMELDSAEAIKEMVAAGLGWSVLPRLSVLSPRHAEHVEVLSLTPGLSRTLAWIIRADKPLTRALLQVQQAVLRLNDCPAA